MPFLTPVRAYLIRRLSGEGEGSDLYPVRERVYVEDWPEDILPTLARADTAPAVLVRSSGSSGRLGLMRVEDRTVEVHVVAKDFLTAHKVDQAIMDYFDGFRTHRVVGDRLVSMYRLNGPLAWRHQDMRWPTVVTTWKICVSRAVDYSAS